MSKFPRNSVQDQSSLLTSFLTLLSDSSSQPQANQMKKHKDHSNKIKIFFFTNANKTTRNQQSINAIFVKILIKEKSLCKPTLCSTWRKISSAIFAGKVAVQNTR
jgi:hypothetical protein